MAAAGMSPMNVIVAATSRAADYLGVRDTGTLARGKRADFLVLDANPLEDIRNTRRIAAIYVGGAMVDRAALRRPSRRQTDSGVRLVVGVARTRPGRAPVCSPSRSAPRR